MTFAIQAENTADNLVDNLAVPMPDIGYGAPMTSDAAPQQFNADNELIKRVKNGDRDAFADLIDRHYDYIYGVAFKFCGTQDAAEDLAQDVCVKLARVISGFEGRSQFRTWLYRIVANLSKDRHKAAFRRTEIGGDALEVGGFVAEERADEAVERSDIWRAVDQLPPRQAECVHLIYGQELSHAEVADLLGCTEKTVSWHVHEAKKALRSLL